MEKIPQQGKARLYRRQISQPTDLTHQSTGACRSCRFQLFSVPLENLCPCRNSHLDTPSEFPLKIGPVIPSPIARVHSRQRCFSFVVQNFLSSAKERAGIGQLSPKARKPKDQSPIRLLVSVALSLFER